MKQRRFFIWKRGMLYFSGIVAAIGILLMIQSFTDREGSGMTHDRSTLMNNSFHLPRQTDFAGESVPLENFDTRESLDRELLVNGYWHSRTLMILKKSRRYFATIEPILKKYGIPDDFKYLAMAESGFENVVSPAKAAGVWQLLESTAIEYGLEVTEEVDERYNLEKSTEAACLYLKESFKLFGNWTIAAATYNAGRKNLENQIAKQSTGNYYNLLLNEETARYVFRLLAHKLITENPEAYGFHLEENDYYPIIPVNELVIDSSIQNIADFALRNATNYKLIKQFNPWLRQNTLSNKTGKAYRIKVPRSNDRVFQ